MERQTAKAFDVGELRVGVQHFLFAALASSDLQLWFRARVCRRRKHQFWRFEKREKERQMRKLTLAAVSLVTILAAGFLIPNHAQALIGAPGSTSAMQAVVPVENV